MPQKLVVRVDRERVPVSGLSKATSNLPAVFLYEPFVERNADETADLNAWARDARKLISAFEVYAGPKVLICVPDAQLTGVEATASKLAQLLTVESTISSFEITRDFASILWTLAYDSLVRADVELSLLSDEAMAHCTPLGNEDRISHKLAEAAAVSATPGRQSDRAELEQRNQLLLLQLERAQQEQAEYFLQYSDPSARVLDTTSTDGIDNHVLINMIKPRRMRETRSFMPMLFDSSYYHKEGGPKFASRAHYLLRGWMLDLNPHPLFDTQYYLGQVSKTLDTVDMPPLVHYLRYGSRLHVSPHPDFDTEFYRSRNPDVVESHWPLLAHFVSHGWREGRMPNAHFNGEWYLATYHDVAEIGMNPFIHYILHGRAEGREQNGSMP